MKIETVTSNTTQWMKQGMIIWRSYPCPGGNHEGCVGQKEGVTCSPAYLRKVVRVINKTTIQIRPLYFYESIFNEFYKWFVLNIRNPFMRWRYKD